MRPGAEALNGVSTSRLPLHAVWVARMERIEREARTPNRILDMMLAV
jgi:hypothetical protein